MQPEVISDFTTIAYLLFKVELFVLPFWTIFFEIASRAGEAFLQACNVFAVHLKKSLLQIWPYLDLTFAKIAASFLTPREEPKADETGSKITINILTRMSMWRVQSDLFLNQPYPNCLHLLIGT
jgi:hypothetical protein